jgi:hypothetical protein
MNKDRWPESKEFVADLITTIGKDPGLDLAGISAYLLEAGQLIAMNDPPTRTVELLRKGAPNMEALRAAIEKFTAILGPNQLHPGDPWRGRPPLTLH